MIRTPTDHVWEEAKQKILSRVQGHDGKWYDLTKGSKTEIDYDGIPNFPFNVSYESVLNDTEEYMEVYWRRSAISGSKAQSWSYSNFNVVYPLSWASKGKNKIPKQWFMVNLVHQVCMRPIKEYLIPNDKIGHYTVCKEIRSPALPDEEMIIKVSDFPLSPDIFEVEGKHMPKSLVFILGDALTPGHLGSDEVKKRMAQNRERIRFRDFPRWGGINKDLKKKNVSDSGFAPGTAQPSPAQPVAEGNPFGVNDLPDFEDHVEAKQLAARLADDMMNQKSSGPFDRYASMENLTTEEVMKNIEMDLKRTERRQDRQKDAQPPGRDGSMKGKPGKARKGSGSRSLSGWEDVSDSDSYGIEQVALLAYNQGAESKSSSLELGSNRVEFFIPALLALISFVIVLIGLKKFLSFRKLCRNAEHSLTYLQAHSVVVFHVDGT